jgi:hypothetical protein
MKNERQETKVVVIAGKGKQKPNSTKSNADPPNRQNHPPKRQRPTRATKRDTKPALHTLLVSLSERKSRDTRHENCARKKTDPSLQRKKNKNKDRKRQTKKNKEKQNKTKPTSVVKLAKNRHPGQGPRPRWKKNHLSKPAEKRRKRQVPLSEKTKCNAVPPSIQRKPREKSEPKRGPHETSVFSPQRETIVKECLLPPPSGGRSECPS